MSKITDREIAKHFLIEVKFLPMKGLWFYSAIDTEKKQVYQSFLDKDVASKAEALKEAKAQLRKMDRRAKHPGHEKSPLPPPGKDIVPDLKGARKKSKKQSDE